MEDMAISTYEQNLERERERTTQRERGTERVRKQAENAHYDFYYNYSTIWFYNANYAYVNRTNRKASRKILERITLKTMCVL